MEIKFDTDFVLGDLICRKHYEIIEDSDLCLTRKSTAETLVTHDQGMEISSTDLRAKRP